MLMIVAGTMMTSCSKLDSSSAREILASYNIDVEKHLQQKSQDKTESVDIEALLNDYESLLKSLEDIKDSDSRVKKIYDILREEYDSINLTGKCGSALLGGLVDE